MASTMLSSEVVGSDRPNSLVMGEDSRKASRAVIPATVNKVSKCGRVQPAFR